MSSIHCRSGSLSDLNDIVATLTLAFVGDPVWDLWAFPDRLHALAQRRALFAIWTESALRYGGVRVSKNCEAVALWYPPDSTGNAEVDQQRLESFAYSHLGGYAATFLAGCDLIERAQRQDVPHYYLSLLATNVAHQHAGWGGALLRACLAEIETAGLPVHLESTRPENDAWYERLGFTLSATIQLPPAGPAFKTYWREPGLKK